jgi:N-acetyl sugar amidotransferase
MKYCGMCLYPEVAVNLDLTDNVCSACRTAIEFDKMSEGFWLQRKNAFEKILSDKKSNLENNYDCIIPVSGGKDSYYQTHKIVTDYGLKPLLVTYHGNNYLPEGDYNRDQMRKVFDADHLVFGPSVEVLKKLNILGFEKMGDMNWHAHCGIFTYPIQIAVKFKIPLIIWGEIAWDIAGMHDPEDYVEFSAKTRHEHGLRGFEWNSFLGDDNLGLTEKDLKWAQYPSDKEIIEAGVKGLYIGNFFKWDANLHTPLMQELYGWKPAEIPFQRTYRKMSNLDDRYENGAHDLLKFVKFGYGRTTDHASKDIRSGLMSREEGVELVKKYDHVISDDLNYWLDYVGMEKQQFWKKADSFRDPRVWWIEGDNWVKENLWGGSSSYGNVYLSGELRGKYIRA